MKLDRKKALMIAAIVAALVLLARAAAKPTKKSPNAGAFLDSYYWETKSGKRRCVKFDGISQQFVDDALCA
jgi:uncharacterized membrane protein